MSGQLPPGLFQRCDHFARIGDDVAGNFVLPAPSRTAVQVDNQFNAIFFAKRKKLIDLLDFGIDPLQIFPTVGDVAFSGLHLVAQQIRLPCRQLLKRLLGEIVAAHEAPVFRPFAIAPGNRSGIGHFVLHCSGFLFLHRLIDLEPPEPIISGSVLNSHPQLNGFYLFRNFQQQIAGFPARRAVAGNARRFRITLAAVGLLNHQHSFGSPVRLLRVGYALHLHFRLDPDGSSNQSWIDFSHQNLIAPDMQRAVLDHAITFSAPLPEFLRRMKIHVI